MAKKRKPKSPDSPPTRTRAEQEKELTHSIVHELGVPAAVLFVLDTDGRIGVTTVVHHGVPIDRHPCIGEALAGVMHQFADSVEKALSAPPGEHGAGCDCMHHAPPTPPANKKGLH